MSDRDNNYGNYSGRWPGVVREYDGARRLCRVEIPGITDGAETLPNAEIEYPIGDKTRGKLATEIEILPDDAVWIAFIGGDPRYPIITGWRLPREGNDVGWRRWHHKNVEILADDTARIQAEKNIEIRAKKKIEIKSDDQIDVLAKGVIKVKGTRIELN